MGALADWAQPLLQALFPPNAEFEDDGDSRLRISWLEPLEGRPNRRARPVALHFARGVVAYLLALTDQSSTLASNRLRALVQAAMQNYPLGAEATEAFTIDVYRDALD